MPDTSLLVKTYLLQDAALLSLLGRFQVKAGDLPEKFDPARGPCVTVKTEGGSYKDETPITDDRVKVRIWAGVNEYHRARTIYNEVDHWLHGKNSIDLSPYGFILRSEGSSRGSDLTDPDTGWATVVAFYQVMARDS